MDKDGLHHIPDLKVQKRKLARGWAGANLSLQLSKWGYKDLFAGAIIDEDTGRKLEYRDLIKRPDLRKRWTKSLANELGRLAQGVRDIKGTNTIFFIPKSEIPFIRRKDVTNGRIVVAYKPNKLETDRSRLTVGGDRIICLFDTSAPTVDLPTIKMLWNSVLSTPGEKYFMMDISNFYLGTSMKRTAFMRLPIKVVPQKIIDKYELQNIVNDGWVYVRTQKGMYGLPQAGKIANDILVKLMRDDG